MTILVSSSGVEVSLKCLMAYHPETGALSWLPRDVSLFTSERNAKSWNSSFAGKPALCTHAGKGYLKGAIFDKDYQTHRVVWALVHGSWPSGVIDHIDGNRSNNRIENLRDVQPVDNRKNTKIRCDSKTGIQGVRWHDKAKRWNAYITIDKRQINLGYFDRIEDARACRQAANAQYGFHPNHGRAA